MKKYFTGFFMSWGMFTSIPCPLKIWDEEARGEMLACFPLTGFVVGILWALAVFITGKIPAVFRAFITALIPWLLTGFMHLDGYMDVCDAVLSRRDLETRQKILKDSRVGAFAVICVILLITGCICACAGIFTETAGAFDLCKLTNFVLIPVVSRCAASLCIMNFKPMGTSQYSGRTYEKRLMVLPALCLCLCFVIPVIFKGSVFVPAGTLAVYLVCALFAKKDLDGMNGDISGFAQTLAEAGGLAAMMFV